MVNPEPDGARAGYSPAVNRRGASVPEENVKVRRRGLDENVSEGGNRRVAVVCTGSECMPGSSPGSDCKCSQAETRGVSYGDRCSHNGPVGKAAEVNQGSSACSLEDRAYAEIFFAYIDGVAGCNSPCRSRGSYQRSQEGHGDDRQ